MSQQIKFYWNQLDTNDYWNTLAWNFAASQGHLGFSFKKVYFHRPSRGRQRRLHTSGHSKLQQSRCLNIPKSAFELFLPNLLDCQALTALLMVLKFPNSGLSPPLSLTQIHFNVHTHQIWWSCPWVAIHKNWWYDSAIFLHSYLTELQVHTDLSTCQDAKAVTSNVENESIWRELLDKQRA